MLPIPADAGSPRDDLTLLIRDIVASLTGPVFAWLFMFGNPARRDLPATLAGLIAAALTATSSLAAT